MRSEYHSKKRIYRSITAVLLSLIMAFLPCLSVPVRTSAVEEESAGLFSWDGNNGQSGNGGRTFIYEGESLTFEVSNDTPTRWVCSDLSQQYVTWKPGRNGKTFTITARDNIEGLEEDGTDIIVTARQSGNASGSTATLYKSATIKVIPNDRFYFIANGKRIETGNISMPKNGMVNVSTSIRNNISIDANNYVEYTSENNFYTLKSTGNVNSSEDPVVLKSSTDIVDDDGYRHSLSISANVYVVGGLSLSTTSTSQTKGLTGRPSTGTLEAYGDGTGDITWKITKASLSGTSETGESTTDDTGEEVTSGITLRAAQSTSRSGGSTITTSRLTVTIDSTLDLSETRYFKIRATQATSDGSTRTEVCDLYVRQPVTSINMPTTQLTLHLTENESSKDNQATLSARCIGDGNIEPDDRSVVWTCTDEGVADIIQADASTCQISGVSPGSCVITVTSRDNPDAVAACYISVVPKVDRVDILQGDMTVNLADKSVQLFANVQSDVVDAKKDTDEQELYSSALNTVVRWYSNNQSVATVDMYSGKVTLLNSGRTVIRCESADDSTISDSISITVNVPVTGITLQPDNLTLSVGQTETINYELQSIPGQSPSNKEVTFESTDEKVATVDNEGKVTGMAGGSCTILVSADDGLVIQECNVRVNQDPSRVELSEHEINVYLGDEDPVLEAYVYPSTATNNKVTWTSNHPDIVSVDQDGILHAQETGSTVVITASVETADRTYSDYCTVHVLMPVSRISLTPDTDVLTVGEKRQLSATVEPEEALADVEFGSTDPSVATVSSTGEVTAVKGGTCYITARLDNRNMMTSAFITVEQDIDKITVSPGSLMMKQGSSYNLRASVSPDSATDKNLVWTSSNKKVVTVSSSGKVKAKGPGTATVTVQGADGGGAKATCRITVRRYVSKITPSSSHVYIPVGKKYRIKSRITPSRASIRKLKYSSSKSSVASVSSKGVIKARKVGSATVTLKATDGSGKKARVRVTVRPKSSIIAVKQ